MSGFYYTLVLFMVPAVMRAQPNDSLLLHLQPHIFTDPAELISDAYSPLMADFEGRTYEYYTGENISGFKPIEGWRTRNLKEVFPNPYRGHSSLSFSKNASGKHLAFYYYTDGRPFTGKIKDRMTVTYDLDRIAGYTNGKPYYFNETVWAVFEADCINGQLQGPGTLTIEQTQFVAATCTFEDGEIVGECTARNPASLQVTKTTYVKGSGRPISSIELDRDGKIIPVSEGPQKD